VAARALLRRQLAPRGACTARACTRSRRGGSPRDGPRDRLHFKFSLLGVFAALDALRDREGLAGAPDWLAEAYRRPREPGMLSEGVPAFSRLAGRSPEHVARTTRAILGITPSEYVNRLRIAQTAFQLRMTSRPVTEIVLDVGNQNLNHFPCVSQPAWHKPAPFPGTSGGELTPQARCALKL